MSQCKYLGPQELARTRPATATDTVTSPFALPSDPFRRAGDLPSPSGKPASASGAFGRARGEAGPVRLSALFAAHESAAASPTLSARTSAFEPEVDVFGEVRTPPETVRVSRRASRRHSKEATPLPMVTSPPPLSPLPALPVQANASLTPSPPKGKLPMVARAAVTSHRRADSDVSQTSSVVSSTGSARGTYFDAYRPIAPASPMTPASLSSPAHSSTASGPSSAARLLPSSNSDRPRPLSQDVRRPAKGSRRGPARPETADDPCLIRKEAGYRQSPPASSP